MSKQRKSGSVYWIIHPSHIVVFCAMSFAIGVMVGASVALLLLG